jgi:hypothetical protein
MNNESTTTDGSPFSFLPWSQGPRNQAARRFRKRCEPAIAHIFEALNSESYMATRPKTNPTTASNYMVAALFKANPTANPTDRTELLHWLGRASAIAARGVEQPWLVRGSLDNAVEEMMKKWAVAAWKGPGDQQWPDWARGQLFNTCAGQDLTEGPHQKWDDLPVGWLPGTTHTQTNAQMDLLTFLVAFEKQSRHMGKDIESLLANSFENQSIGRSCFALRILYGTTAKIADPSLYEPLQFFENRYDHQHISLEILKIVSSAVDRRILTNLAADIDGGVEDKKTPKPRRKI